MRSDRNILELGNRFGDNTLRNSTRQRVVTKKRQFDECLVEPNSGLGMAIDYLRKHWRQLTLFLQQVGAPADNNVCERALKKAAAHYYG